MLAHADTHPVSAIDTLFKGLCSLCGLSLTASSLCVAVRLAFVGESVGLNPGLGLVQPSPPQSLECPCWHRLLQCHPSFSCRWVWFARNPSPPVASLKLKKMLTFVECGRRRIKRKRLQKLYVTSLRHLPNYWVQITKYTKQCR